MTKLSKVTTAILGVCIAACAAGFVLLGAFDIAGEGIILSALALVFVMIENNAARSGQKPKPGNAAGALVIAGVTMLITLTTPPFISSSAKWRYSMQRAYIDRFKNVKAPEEFPDFINDVESGYKFEYFPALMQASGYYSVTFTASPETAADYAGRFAPMAKYTVPLNEFISDGSYMVEDFTPRENSTDDGSLAVFVSDGMRSGCSDSAKVYVLEAALNRNHPHSTAVIVDTETGKIQLSRLG